MKNMSGPAWVNNSYSLKIAFQNILLLLSIIIIINIAIIVVIIIINDHLSKKA